MPVLLLALALLASAPSSDRGAPPAPVAFLVEETLHQPAPDGVALTLVPAEAAVLRVQYGNDAVGTLHTRWQRVRAGRSAFFRLGGLPRDGSYSYQVEVRRPGETRSVLRPAHGFRTLRSAGSTFSFAVMADSHAWALWAQSSCTTSPDLPWQQLQETLRSLAEDGSLDFVVGGSDHVMTACPSCEACSWNGQPSSAGSVSSLEEARLRYRRVLAPDCYGLFGADLPQLLVLGDHDGEEGWEGVCGATAEVAAWSRQARLELFPHPTDVYGGNRQGSAYSLRTGDLLLVVLDPLSTTPDITLGPDSWTLGPDQLAWLERVLATSDATFKVVFAEHLLGGISAPGSPCWKGRGGIRSTIDGLPTSPFAGEQALVHELLKAHGAQVFFTFHDHVVAVGEKPGPDGLGEGVTYVIGGRAGGVGNGWTNQPWYREAMDYDGDGVPEYDTDVTGTRRPGYFKVTVHGDERVDFLYMVGSNLPGGSPEPLLGFSILP